MLLERRLSATLLAVWLAGCGACSVKPRQGAETAPVAGVQGPPPAGLDLREAELVTVGWDGLTGSPVVLLREVSTGQVLPIWIGLAEARSISLELFGVDPPRPMTHDLMTNLLAALDATLEEVVVTELRENTYYGLLKLRLLGRDEPRWIDTRPSDGLALALRTGAAIKVAAKLLEEQGDFQFLAPEPTDQVVRILGLTVTAASGPLREEYSLGDRAGLFVAAVTGIAAEQGFRRGDLIVEAGGQKLQEPVDLLDAARGAAPGGVLSLQVLRGGEELQLELPLWLGEPPPGKGDTIAA